MAEKKRSYHPREKKLVVEYAHKKYGDALQWRNVRIGKYPDGKVNKMFSVLRRYADLIVDTPKEVVIIEAKMTPKPGAIMQLLLYKELFPETPEFSALKDKPIKLIFLSTIEDKVVQKLAARHGVEYAVYSPKWVQEYLKELHRLP